MSAIEKVLKTYFDLGGNEKTGDLVSAEDYDNAVEELAAFRAREDALTKHLKGAQDDALFNLRTKEVYGVTIKQQDEELAKLRAEKDVLLEAQRDDRADARCQAIAANRTIAGLLTVEKVAKAVSDAQPLMGDEDEHLLRALRAALTARRAGAPATAPVDEKKDGKREFVFEPLPIESAQDLKAVVYERGNINHILAFCRDEKEASDIAVALTKAADDEAAEAKEEECKRCDGTGSIPADAHFSDSEPSRPCPDCVEGK